MRVLVLRPDDGARRTIARLNELGHEAISSPVLETAATNEAAPAGPFDGLVATSAQAFRQMEAPALQPFMQIPLFCVGARTAAAAREAGFRDIRIEARDAAQLAGAIAQAPPLKRLLYLAGRDRKPGLEKALQDCGVQIAPWVIYEARAVASLGDEALDALRNGRVDAAFHFSRRSASIFYNLISAADLANEARALLHVCISTDAAEGLRGLSPPHVRVADAPDEARMIERLG